MVAALACTPHPGWGTVSFARKPGLVRTVDLETCRTWTSAPKVVIPTLTATASAISYRGRVVYTHPRREGPIELEGMSPDRRWIFFAIDPQGSASLAADGLTLQVVSVHGGRARTVASGLLYPDYRTWCGSTRLVMTAGGDRLAGHNKWLVYAEPPDWRVHVIVRDPKRAFGSVVCAPDGESVIVQSARATGVNDNAQPLWSLWRYFWYDHSLRRLTTPPHGYSDDSPRIAADQRRIMFVRSRRDRGVLYGLGTGPLLDVGSDENAYYGHRAWAFLSWSLQR